MHHEEDIQHLVAEVQQQVTEVFVAVDVAGDVAAAIVEDDDAVAIIGVEVPE